jgi:hypothetical protein
MYRTEILGMHLPNTIPQKPTDELTMSGSRLSNDSGYVDEMKAKNPKKNAEVSFNNGKVTKYTFSVRSASDKITGRLESIRNFGSTGAFENRCAD